MTDLIIPRRQFIAGMIGLLTAPAIVRVSSLMPIKSYTERVVESVEVVKPGIIRMKIVAWNQQDERSVEHVYWIPDGSEPAGHWREINVNAFEPIIGVEPS